MELYSSQSKQAAAEEKEKQDALQEAEEKPKEGVVVERKRANNICKPGFAGNAGKYADDDTIDNASNFSTGQAAASLTSTALAPTTKNDKALFDEVSGEESTCSKGTA
jgi:hypothetical protein